MGREPSTPPRTTRGSDIPTPRKVAAAIDLSLARSPRGTKYKRNELKRLSAKHNIGETALKQIGKLSREQVQRGEEIDLSHKRMGREPSTLKRTPEIDRTIRQVNKRTKGRLSVRAFHAELQRKEGVDVQSHTTVHKWLQELDAFKHKRSVIPTLTHDQRVWRVDYCLNMLGPRQRTLPEFYDVVHVDEKWFWLMPDGEIVRGIPEANGSITLPSPPTAQHKNAIPKAMFLTANARPRPEYGFNGKLGIWRVTGLKEALRKSKNHERGDTYEVDVSITAAVYRRLLEEKVYPAIKQKMWWKKIGNGRLTCWAP